jgi:hypothetical protein
LCFFENRPNAIEMTKRKKRSNKQREKKAQDMPQSAMPPPPEQPNKSGGWPDIDFKKNLGCG